MADKKISALTAATTPLAGTEVLPIVQGGATTKVAVSNLTAGRVVGALAFRSSDHVDPTAVSGMVVDANFLRLYINNSQRAYLSATELGIDGNLLISTAGKGIDFGASVLWRTGAGSPEGVVTAAVGSLYTRTDGGANTTLYVKQSGTGNTGWAAK